VSLHRGGHLLLLQKIARRSSSSQSTVVQGIAPRQHLGFTESQLEATVLCNEIATAKGQRASVRLLPGIGRNVVFGIDHVIDPGYQPAAGVRFKVLERPARAWVLEAENCNRRQ